VIRIDYLVSVIAIRVVVYGRVTCVRKLSLIKPILYFIGILQLSDIDSFLEEITH